MNFAVSLQCKRLNGGFSCPGYQNNCRSMWSGVVVVMAGKHGLKVRYSQHLPHCLRVIPVVQVWNSTEFEWNCIEVSRIAGN